MTRDERRRSDDVETTIDGDGDADREPDALTERMSIESQDPDAAGEDPGIAREEQEVRAEEPEAKS